MIEMLKRHEIQVLRLAGHTWQGVDVERHVRADGAAGRRRSGGDDGR